MTLSTPRSLFGIHSVAPYSRADGTYYGILKILESSSLALTGKQIDLYGGSNKYPWASETGEISAEMSLKVAQVEDFMFYLFLGKQPTQTLSETAGNVGAAVNKKGTSMIAATGILTPVVIPSTGAANLKFGQYVIKATSATAFDLFVSSDVDFNRGTAGSYTSDLLKIASVTGVATGANSDVSAYGLRFTGGASATAFVTGDTAEFAVRPINSKASVANIGSAADIFPEFGALIVAQKRGSDELFELDAYRCKASGMPIGLDMFAWNKTDVKVKLLYDSALDGVFAMRAITI